MHADHSLGIARRRHTIEEVLELGVAEVRVDLSRILDASGGQLEAVHSPLEVGIALRALAERETLTKSRLIDLDNVDAVLLEVENLVTESQSELLALDGLVNIVTRERPPQAGDWASKHALHGLLGPLSSILGLLNGHGSRARDIANNDGRTHAARAVRLDPGMGGEDEALEALTEVLNHVVTFRLAVDVDIEAKLILDLDGKVDLLLDEFIVLLRGDLTLGELGTLDTDLVGLREGADGGGREQGQAEVSPLLSIAGLEVRLAVVHSVGDLSLALCNSRVVGAGRLSTRLHGSSVGIELGADRLGVNNGLGEYGDLLHLLDGEGEPLIDIGRELLLAGKGVGDVQEGAGSGNDNALRAKGLDSGVEEVKGFLKVVLPDVAAVNDTSREDLVGAELLENWLQLLRVTNKVDMETVEVGEGREDIEVVDDVAKVGGNGDGRDLAGLSRDSLIGRLEGGLDLGPEVEDEDGLVDLDVVGTSSLELLQELDVDRHELVNEGDGVDLGATVGLAKGKEGDGADEDGAGVEASLLGLEELAHRLGILSEGEGLVVLESWLHVMIVRVEPLDHLEGRDVDVALLVATAHGEVLIKRRELLAPVALRDSLCSKSRLAAGRTSAAPQITNEGRGGGGWHLTLKSWMWSRMWS